MTIESDIVKETLVKVAKIWDELGVDQAYRKNQIDTASEKIIEIYNHLLKKEERHKEDIIKDIISGLESLCTMSTELGETVNDTHQSLSTMTLFQRLEYIEYEKGKLRKKTEDRIGVIEDLEFGIEEISKEMELKDLNQTNVDESTIQGNDYSLDKISSLQKKYNALKVQRDESFKNIYKLSIEIYELWEELRVSPDTELENSIISMTQANINSNSPISLSLATTQVLEQKRNKLLIIKSEHESMVRDYAQKITILWDKLEVPDEEREDFFSKTAGLGSDVIEACREELERVEEIRKNSLLDLVQKEKDKIENYYNLLHLPMEKLTQVVEENGLNMDQVSEDLLDLFELELSRVMKLYELSKPLLQLIEKREYIRNLKIEYEQTILGDKERLLSKKFDRARFEKEKELSTAFQKLPPIEENLKKQLVSWQNTYGQSFCYEGFNYLELMSQQSEHEKKIKESEKIRKQIKAAEGMGIKYGGSNSVNSNNNTNSSNTNGTIKKSNSSTFNGASAPKTPTSSRVLKTVQTPSTPKTPKSVRTIENNVQSPYSSASVPVKPLLKKRVPLSPLNMKNLSNTPGKSNSKPLSAGVSPKKKTIQFSLGVNQNLQNINNNNNINNENDSTNSNGNKLFAPTSSQISSSSSSSSSSTNTSNITSNNISYNSIQSNNTPFSTPMINPFKTTTNNNYFANNDSMMIANNQYNDDMIMNDTIDPSSMI
ncbi:hypothetical protein DICPUDRAFT_86636 [Dictyostelium purpureum]|uniref:Protein regulator of cytokinesis 1 n=1 Tax=Dictyostelium purpureum TaxID=5786 RepID=F0ZCY3_DICPU|nr:uncharacterized protein DICPUDRAFT_86636 [Dictyostelium purpureum]EGC38239.1 hypothetical protein DICPUDRAFT_86636 [Dictyostelium purpureum]|eukprot:XP_003285277.1 hypothetical protein DICPUDRAFT_86636 [Dictyostelium purpureum]